MERLESRILRNGKSGRMIRYAKNHTIDRAKFDLCVRLDQSGLPYALSWYLDTVCENWDALILNDYNAVWPLPWRRKLGLKYFYRPFGIQQLGFFSKRNLTEKQMLGFIAEMKKHCRFADVFLNENQWADTQNLGDFKAEINRNLVLNLNVSYREIYHGYKSNTRRNIKKSNDKKLSVFENDGPEILVQIFKENQGKKLKLDEQFYQNIKKIMYQCIHKGMGKLWTVYGEGNQVLAGAFFIENERRVTLLFTGVNSQGREAGAMFYLLNEYIIFASGRPLLLDFEGSNAESLARFYKGFGAREENYMRLVYNHLPWPLKWLKK